MSQRVVHDNKRIDLALLVLLAGEALDGYRLARTLRAVRPGLLWGGVSRIYPALHRLEHGGLLAGEWCLTPDGRRRRIYFLTTDGHRALELLALPHHNRRPLLGVGLLLLGGAALLSYSLVTFLASLLLLTPGLLLLLAGAVLLSTSPNLPSPPAACGRTSRLHVPTDEPAVTASDAVPSLRVPVDRSE